MMTFGQWNGEGKRDSGRENCQGKGQTLKFLKGLQEIQYGYSVVLVITGEKWKGERWTNIGSFQSETLKV